MFVPYISVPWKADFGFGRNSGQVWEDDEFPARGEAPPANGFQCVSQYFLLGKSPLVFECSRDLEPRFVFLRSIWQQCGKLDTGEAFPWGRRVKPKRCSPSPVPQKSTLNRSLFATCWQMTVSSSATKLLFSFTSNVYSPAGISIKDPCLAAAAASHPAQEWGL